MSCISTKLKKAKRLLNVIELRLHETSNDDIQSSGNDIDFKHIKGLSHFKWYSTIHIVYTNEKEEQDIFIDNLTMLECITLIAYLNDIIDCLIKVLNW